MRSLCDCGARLEPAQYVEGVCPTCATARNEAQQHFAAENPGCSQSDILYAGRQAMQARRQTAHSNFVDPRDFHRFGR